MTTAYDIVAYPMAIFQQTHPERLAVLARLHGLPSADPARCRMLDIGCGSGMHLLSLAAAYPQAQFVGFDLAESAIAEGRALAADAGLTNVELYVGDIMDEADGIAPGSFDYVTAHGVYAWVPPVVRDATMRLTARALAPDGVALISYNSLPGGYCRMIMRDMLQHALVNIDDPALRIEAMRAVLSEIANTPPGEDPSQVMVHAHAEAMLERPLEVLFHDELGDEYHPQRLTDVVAAARAAGLAFLTDGGRNRYLDGFMADAADEPEDGDLDAAVLQEAQSDDYRAVRYFRHTVLVRDTARPARRVNPAHIAGMSMTTRLSHAGGDEFVHKNDRIAVGEAELCDALIAVIDAQPAYVPIAPRIHSDIQLKTVIAMYDKWHCELHLTPQPYVLDVGAHPCTSPLIRAQIRRGDSKLCTLQHGFMTTDQPELRALLLAADGTRSMVDMVALADDIGIPAEQIADALAAAAAKALMVASPV